MTEDALAPRLPPTSAHVVSLDGDAKAIAARPATVPPCSSRLENLAYVIYTSGSTGRPKGVMVTHRNLANLLTVVASRPGLSAGEMLLAVTTLSFDIAALELYLPLVAGAACRVASRREATDPHRLAALLERCGPSAMQATPMTWRLLVEAEWAGRPGMKALCGGEALSPHLAGQLLRRGVELWNLYGPTETTVWSTAHHVTDARPPVAIGRPVANTIVRLLDEELRHVPLGEAAELFIGGAGVARGYLGRPDLTAERFMPDPARPGQRLYRTGDLARWRPDGNLELLGRIDTQVKIRGVRIEPGEIESVLVAHPAVAAAAVVATDDSVSGRRLVAHVETRGRTPAVDDIRRFLLDHLPAHMVPAAIVLVTRLPLTPNGKLDRGALLTVGTARRADEPAFVAPRDGPEAALAEL